MKFYNREKEIAELVRIWELAFAQNSRMVVLKGNLLVRKQQKKDVFAVYEQQMLIFVV